MRLISLFLAVGLFAACQTEGGGISEIDAGIDADDGMGPQRGGEGRIPDAGIPDSRTLLTTPDALPDALPAPDSLPTSPDTLPPKDTLNVDAMTRAERCATGNPAIYAYAWPTACADLAAWCVACPKESAGLGACMSNPPTKNEDCAWAYCVGTGLGRGTPITCTK